LHYIYSVNCNKIVEKLWEVFKHPYLKRKFRYPFLSKYKFIF